MSRETSDDRADERRSAARWRAAGIVIIVATLLLSGLIVALTARPTALLYAIPFLAVGVIALLVGRRDAGVSSSRSDSR